MTASAEVDTSGLLEPGWREERELAQVAALPRGRVLVSCSAPLGSGGLGRHRQEIVDALARGGARAMCPEGSPGERAGQRASARGAPTMSAATAVLAPLARRSPPWRAWLENVAFDNAAARRTQRADHLIAFNGEALQQLGAARRAGIESASLMSATSHMRQVVRMHALAHGRHPLERSWATRLLARNVAEYARADRIYVSSPHARESFAREGVPESKLALFPLTPAARFAPTPHVAAARDAPSSDAPRAACFTVVYVGSLSVAKGVPLLVDAVRSLPHSDLRLVLVGGWGTRGMRRFLEEARAADPRIELRPGDPLAHLQRATLCVHPSYEDGFAYAPVEALACGVPAIVSENTGMKHLIEPGRNGLVLPTGEQERLAEAIDACYRGEILSA